MTPRQFNCLVERYQEHEKKEDRRAGEIIAILYNANRDPKNDPKGLDWQDVFPEWKKPPKPQTEEEMFEVMKLFAARSIEGLSS